MYSEKQTKMEKAEGYDNIEPQIMKWIKNEFAKDWKTDLILLIHKKRNHMKYDNYTAIPSSIEYKIYTTIRD